MEAPIVLRNRLCLITSNWLAVDNASRVIRLSGRWFSAATLSFLSSPSSGLDVLLRSPVSTSRRITLPPPPFPGRGGTLRKSAGLYKTEEEEAEVTATKKTMDAYAARSSRLTHPGDESRRLTAYRGFKSKTTMGFRTWSAAETLGTNARKGDECFRATRQIERLFKPYSIELRLHFADRPSVSPRFSLHQPELGSICSAYFWCSKGNSVEPRKAPRLISKFCGWRRIETFF